MSSYSIRYVKYPIGDAIDVVNQIDDNIDVFVDLSDGRTFVVSLFTIENIRNTLESDRANKRWPYGLYFFATNMVIVNYLSRDSVDQVIGELVASGDVELVGLPVDSLG